jgi:hypothetical protein
VAITGTQQPIPLFTLGSLSLCGLAKFIPSPWSDSRTILELVKSMAEQREILCPVKSQMYLTVSDSCVAAWHKVLVLLGVADALHLLFSTLPGFLSLGLQRQSCPIYKAARNWNRPSQSLPSFLKASFFGRRAFSLNNFQLRCQVGVGDSPVALW